MTITIAKSIEEVYEALVDIREEKSYHKIADLIEDLDWLVKEDKEFQKEFDSLQSDKIDLEFENEELLERIHELEAMYEGENEFL